MLSKLIITLIPERQLVDVNAEHIANIELSSQEIS